MNAVTTKVKQYPIRIYAFGVYLLQMATAFGFDVTAEQNATIIGAFGALMAIVADKFTTPVSSDVSIE